MTTLSRRSFLAHSAAVAATPLLPALTKSDDQAKPAAKFRLGLVTYNVAPNWDLPTVLGVCKRVGIAAVECRTTHKHGVEPKLSSDERKKVKQQFADAGVVFWGSGSTCEFHSDNPDVVKKNIEDCKRFIGLVKDLGGTGVKVRPNGVVKGKSVDESCEQIGKALIECGKAAADAGVEIWVEVHGAVTSKPENMRKIMDACGHKSVGVTWNSNDSDLTDGKLEPGFSLLKDHIKSCHITDLTKDKAGKYPYRELFARFQAMGYDRYTLCEYPKSFDPEAGEKFLAEYKALWSELVKG